MGVGIDILGCTHLRKYCHCSDIWRGAYQTGQLDRRQSLTVFKLEYWLSLLKVITIVVSFRLSMITKILYLTEEDIHYSRNCRQRRWQQLKHLHRCQKLDRRRSAVCWWYWRLCFGFCDCLLRLWVNCTRSGDTYSTAY